MRVVVVQVVIVARERRRGLGEVTGEGEGGRRGRERGRAGEEA